MRSLNIPGYELQRRVASGGFGDVWLARADGDTRMFAIKLVRSELLSDPDLVKRFEREIALCRTLHHPNIVPILESGITANRVPFFVMPFVEGRTLRQELRTAGRLEPSRAIKIALQVCDALAFAHEAGIVHRDMKSSNIMLGQGDSVQVFDFGLAKLLADDGPNLTRSLEVLGTPACMAPEQAQGKDVDERTDIYALGVLLFELFAGSLPFAASSMTVLSQLHLYAQRPRLGEHIEHSGSLNQIIAKAMEIEPSRRFQSVRSLAIRLTAVCDSPAQGQEANSVLVQIQDRISDIAESEDVLDEVQEKLEVLGASLLIRASHRIALLLSPVALESMRDDSSGDTSDSLDGALGSVRLLDTVSISIRRVQVAWQDGEPIANALLDEPWPNFVAGGAGAVETSDATTVRLDRNS